MQGQYTNNGDGTSTLTLSHTGPTQKVVETIDAAIKDLWDRGFKGPHGGVADYSLLTVSQKLDILSLFVSQEIVKRARADFINTAVEEATIAAESEANNKYI